MTLWSAVHRLTNGHQEMLELAWAYHGTVTKYELIANTAYDCWQGSRNNRHAVYACESRFKIPAQLSRKITAVLLHMSLLVAQIIESLLKSSDGKRPQTDQCVVFLNFVRKTDWFIEQGLTSHQTHYRSYWEWFLQVIWPNQPCQSTEGEKEK